MSVACSVISFYSRQRRLWELIGDKSQRGGHKREIKWIINWCMFTGLPVF
jgi:hypothetical protein